MKWRAAVVGMVAVCGVSITVAGEERREACLDPLSVQLRYPAAYEVRPVEASAGWASLAKYEMAAAGGRTTWLVSMQLTAHDKISIREFMRQCEESNAEPDSSGDVLCEPTPAMFEARRQMVGEAQGAADGKVIVFGGRRFVVSQRYEEPSGLYIRTYSTFFGEVMLDVRIAMRKAEQARDADTLLSAISFEEGACRRARR